MKTYIKYILAGLLSTSLFPSCSDILDKKPLTEISEDDLWNDPALVEGFVNSRYNPGRTWLDRVDAKFGSR